MNKLFFTFIFSTAFMFTAQAQTSFGVKAGMNIPYFTLDVLGGMRLSTESSTNFYITGFVDQTIAPSLSIQPGISLQGKGAKGYHQGTNEKADLSLMYVEVPVNFVYYQPIGSGSLFVGAGPYGALGLAAKIKSGDEKQSGTFKEGSLNTVDAGVNFLLGYKVANGFLMNAGYSIGLTNIARDEHEDTTKNRVFSIGVGYQF